MPLDDRGAHGRVRSQLRVLGPILILAGAIFLTVGVADFFAGFASGPRRVEFPALHPTLPGEPPAPFGATSAVEPKPSRFWCAFVGAPLLALGVWITKFAYLGAAVRYVATEVAPVGADVANYLVAGTRGAVRDLAGAIGEGVRAGGSAARGPALACRSCDAANDADARFCKGCGTPVVRSNVCAGCGEPNDLDAKYCDHCGKLVG